MPATYHAPMTFTVGQFVTATQLNEQIRDNTLYLLQGRPISATTHLDGPYTSTSASYAYVSPDTLRIDKTINGTRILAMLTGTLFEDTSPYVSSVRLAAFNNSIWQYSAAFSVIADTIQGFAIPFPLTNLVPGSVALVVQMKTTGGLAQLSYPRLLLLEV